MGVLWTSALNFQSIETYFIAERSEHGAVKMKTAELMERSKSDTLDFFSWEAAPAIEVSTLITLTLRRGLAFVHLAKELEIHPIFLT